MSGDTEKYPVEPGIDRMYAIFYRFSARVADGDATPSEVSFMSRVLGIAEERGDLNVGFMRGGDGR